MAGFVRNAVVVLALAGLCGCSIQGDWKTVSVEPQEYTDKMFSTVSFGKDNMYTSTATYGGMVVTSTGNYKWNGMTGTLDVMPQEGETRQYKGSLMWGKTLTLEMDRDGEKIKGVMERKTSDN